MLEPESRQLNQLVASAAFKLQQDLIRATGSNFIEAGTSERVTFEGIPIAPVLDVVPGIRDAPFLLYGSQANDNDIIHAWGLLAKELHSAGVAYKAHAAIKSVYPNLPVKGLRLPELAVRFLCLAGWQRGSLKIGSRSIHFQVDGITYGIVGPNLYGANIYRLTDYFRPDILSAISNPTGEWFTSTAKTSGVYRRLTTLMPDKADEILTLARVAVQAGRQFEATMTEPFDVVLVKNLSSPGDAWAEARELIKSSRVNPTPQIYRLLAHHVRYADFVKQFGNPYRHGTTATAKSRLKLAAALSELESATAGSTQAYEALDILDLQQSIARLHV